MQCCGDADKMFAGFACENHWRALWVRTVSGAQVGMLANSGYPHLCSRAVRTEILWLKSVANAMF